MASLSLLSSRVRARPRHLRVLLPGLMLLLAFVEPFALSLADTGPHSVHGERHAAAVAFGCDDTGIAQEASSIHDRPLRQVGHGYGAQRNRLCVQEGPETHRRWISERTIHFDDPWHRVSAGPPTFPFEYVIPPLYKLFHDYQI